ncbi:MAG TPA: hypothetical protein DIT39_07030 [Tissierellales bacterium]|nr:hypothetical protein [Tissierellales bacterium]
MSRATRQAITVLGAASIAIQTISNSFPDISPGYKKDIQEAHRTILHTCADWPGANAQEGKYVFKNLQIWTKSLTNRKIEKWVMATLASLAVTCVTDLYEKPTSRLQRPLLDDLLPLLIKISETVEGGRESSYQANKLADEMLRELYLLIDWKIV